MQHNRLLLIKVYKMKKKIRVKDKFAKTIEIELSKLSDRDKRLNERYNKIRNGNK